MAAAASLLGVVAGLVSTFAAAAAPLASSAKSQPGVANARAKHARQAPGEASSTSTSAVTETVATSAPVGQTVTASSSLTPSNVTENPAVVGWGENFSGQLGGGFINNYMTWPVSAPAMAGVKSVTAGYHFSLTLLQDGTVRGWGGNSYGQLGDGNRFNSFGAAPVAGLSGVTEVAAGGAHAIALLSNGAVATWGGDAFGQLGNGTTGAGSENVGYSSTVPVYLKGPGGVVAVAAGGADDAALLSNGTVMAWGENSSGQLGDGTEVEKDVPTPVRGLAGVRAIALGADSSHGGHLLALLDNGTVMAVGANGSGQLGDGSTEDSSTPVPVKGLSGVVAIAASPTHSMALLSDGTIRAWGNDAFGELGVGPGPETCYTGIARWPCSRVPRQVSGLSGVTAISAGWRFSLAVSAGRLYSWGWNEMGRLGNSTTVSTNLPAAAGPSNVVAISAGEQHSEALLSAGAPAPEVELSSGPRCLTVAWRSSYETERWYVAHRPVTYPRSEWREWTQLPAATRSYTLSGLVSGQRYEVIVKNALFGARTTTGTAG